MPNKNKITSPFYEYEGKVWHINADEGKAIRSDILKRILALAVDMQKRHCKLFICRFDLRISEYTPDNSLLSDFLRRTMRAIKRKYGAAYYCWAREQERSKKQHYHFALIMNGNNIRQPHGVQEIISKQSDYDSMITSWAGYHFFTRDEQEKLSEAAYHISYLAKTRGKGYQGNKAHDYGSSNLIKQEKYRI